MRYSSDLRKRVLTFIETGGSKPEASGRFDVSRPTIDKWLKHRIHWGMKNRAPEKNLVDPNLYFANGSDETILYTRHTAHVSYNPQLYGD